MIKKTIAVFFGGKSAEHDVSIVTALGAVIKPLELSGMFDVVPVYIAKNGGWYSDTPLKNIEMYSSGKIDEYVKKAKKIQLLFDDGLVLVYQGLTQKRVKIDVAFPAMHGTYGEDGSLMGVLRMAQVPFVGSDLTASAIAMDKVFSKQIVLAHGISTPKFISFSSKEFESTNQEIIVSARDLQLPLFVKPASLGSSIGITKVAEYADLQNAVEVAAHYDDKILIEEGVQNLIEVTVPIIGNEDIHPALVEQPLLSAEDFFDFDTKYMNGGKKGKGSKQSAQGYSNLPADLPKKLYDEALDVAMKSYRAIGCSGISRVDLLIDSAKERVYFNELNPLPGDLYKHNWRAAGVSPVQLVTQLVDLAEERYREKQKLESVFQTNYLKQF